MHTAQTFAESTYTNYLYIEWRIIINNHKLAEQISPSEFLFLTFIRFSHLFSLVFGRLIRMERKEISNPLNSQSK